MGNNANTKLPWESSFAQALTRARTAAGMSQSELARRAQESGLSFHQQIIARIESEVRPVRLNEAHVLARIFGMNLEDLDHAHVGDDTAYARALDAAGHATRTARRTIIDLRTGCHQLDAATEAAAAAVTKYRTYTAGNPDAHAQSLAELQATLDRLERVSTVLRQALEATTDDNQEPE